MKQDRKAKLDTVLHRLHHLKAPKAGVCFCIFGALTIIVIESNMLVRKVLVCAHVGIVGFVKAAPAGVDGMCGTSLLQPSPIGV